MKKFLKSEEKQTIILLLLLLLILFLDSTGINAESIGGILGGFIGSLGLGIILGNIYFKLNKKERNSWQRWRTIVIIALTVSLWRLLPSIWLSFSAGFQKGSQKGIR